MPWTCAPSLLPSASNASATELASSGCLASTPESDHGNGDVHAAGERVGLRQSKLGDRILRDIALGLRLFLILQQVAEIELHRLHAAIGREFASNRFRGAPIDDAEQADGAAQKRKLLRCEPLEAVAPRQFIGLRERKRAVDLRDKLILDRAKIDRSLRRRVVARAAIPALARDAIAGAAGRDNGAIETFAVRTAVGVFACRIEIVRVARVGKLLHADTQYSDMRVRCPHNRRTAAVAPDRRHSRDGGNADAGAAGDGRIDSCPHCRIDARCHRRIDRCDPGIDVQARRAHDALRVSRRNAERSQWQRHRCQCQCHLPRFCLPIHAKVDHGTSAWPATRPTTYGVATARLTIFSPCSLAIRPATSSLLIARLPNCSRNMPLLPPSTIEAW